METEKPGAGGAFGQAAREIEAEVQRVLAYIEERVVPRARRDGEKLLRRLSAELDQWADHLGDSSSAKKEK